MFSTKSSNKVGSRGRTQEYMGTGWHGLGWGGGGGGGVVKNKFGLTCFLDDFKCYKAFFFLFFFLDLALFQQDDNIINVLIHFLVSQTKPKCR